MSKRKVGRKIQWNNETEKCAYEKNLRSTVKKSHGGHYWKKNEIQKLELSKTNGINVKLSHNDYTTIALEVKDG